MNIQPSTQQHRLATNQPFLSFVELFPVLIPYFIGFFIFRGYYSVLPLYIQVVNGYSDSRIVELWGLISGIGLFFGAITRIPAGLVSDRFGRVNTFVLGFALYVVSLVIIMLGDSVLIYIIGFILIRSTVNLFAMTGRGIVSTSTREKGVKNGLLSSMVGFGSFLGPSVLGYTLDHYQADSIFFLSFFFIVTDFILFIVVVPFGYRIFQIFAAKDEPYDIDLSRVQSVKFTLTAFKMPGIKLVLLLFFMAGIIFGYITNVYSLYGYNILSFSISFVSFVVGVASVVQIVWAPIVGKLYASVKDAHMRAFAWTIIILATIFVLLAKINSWFYVGGFLLLALGNASFFTMEITRIGLVVKREHFAIVFGTATSISILGSALASYTSPIFYNIIPEGTFVMSFVASIISVIFIIVFNRS